ncbi:MAG: hypothetical protein GY795_38490 [Desulfobacterales bacterium]|nr:hypothetical protein [Desulfobacterales bacterium]
MKKQNAYTIKDEIFLDALEIIHNNFNEIPYAIVGGGAVQVYAASVSIKNAGLKSVKDINGLSLILRRTGDIDLSFNYDVAKLTEKLNFIIEKCSGVYTFHNFAKRFVIQDKNRRFNLNYQTEPEDMKGIPSYYHDIIHTSIAVDLPYKNKNLHIRIARPEYLVISKLTRIKPKDQVDILLLLKASEMDNYPFDTEEVRSVLKSVNQEDNYSILAELMDSL